MSDHRPWAPDPRSTGHRYAPSQPYGDPDPAHRGTYPPRGRTAGIVLAGCAFLLASAIVGGLSGGIAGLAVSQVLEGNGGLSSGTSLTVEPVARAAEAALPSVVNIDVTSGSGTGDTLPNGHPDVPSGGTGSGVAFRRAPNGGTYLITNNHVVETAEDIVVTPADGERAIATLVGRDPETDIAVIRIDRRIPILQVADSDDLVAGQTVVAIGSPFGLQHSVSSGVVSAVHRAITSGFSREGTRTTMPLVDVIQTDAAINPGNSGGALVDRRGMLVGINTALYSETGSSSGIGFAIPSNTALRIAGELVEGGSAKHPFLGVEGRTITPAQATQLGLPSPEGAFIERVLSRTGAARAGLKAGDVVVGLDGDPVRTMDDLILAVRRTRVGEVVELKIWRARSRRTLEMTVGDKPSDLP